MDGASSSGPAEDSAVDRGERFLLEAGGEGASPGLEAARGLAATLEALVEVLVPGDELFPSASEVGVHGLLGDTVREVRGQPVLDAVSEALISNGRLLHEQPPLDRVKSVRRFEREEPELFSFVRVVVYYGYYKDPSVTRAIRALGHDYNDAPQPKGYEMVPFDPGVDAPSKPRGRYVRTEEVVRVNLDGLGLEPREGTDERR